ncbi:Lipase precursor [Pseudovibrio axinellae]|uniref:Lipase n=1 Tax=Pseudovibrio axinellae TaxID=989403 RepID=A0A166AQK5_9HYPH|nr:triacylglycerol lipase [Pseudovibrio axinellae]KZL21428.1 Lipase precursor [Pseudovibrio axinellae]SEQ99970.1 Hemolysin-type calcium-binding repeat-containing protein [Pseudovibrio axinellae]
MSLFEYKGSEAVELVSDALDLMLYSYHGLDDALGSAYQENGFSLATLVGAMWGTEDAEGLLNGESEQAARDKIEEKGWTVLTADDLGYEEAQVDHNGTFQGETFEFKDAQADVLAKYDEEGNITQVALAFRGTTGTLDNIISDSIGDVIDYLEFFQDEPHYVEEAFGGLLSALKDFMIAHGLEGNDLIVTGHSLGGGAVANMAERSNAWLDGFFVDANYLAFASHYTPEDGASVLDSGAELLSFDLENDPVPSVISSDGLDVTGNDTDYGYDTSNIVIFNDWYDTILYQDGGGILNLPSWSAHLPFNYSTAFNVISASSFYGEMTRDSLVVISGLSDQKRDDTWVEDLPIFLDPTGHYGQSAYILGSEKDDLLRGNSGDDGLEGFAGNDHLRGEDGNDRLLGGAGDDILEGGDGDDVLHDGQGADFLIGGDGADTFCFVDDGQLDVIDDFDVGEDVIDLSAAGVTSFAELEIDASILGGWVSISYGDDVLDVDTAWLFTRNLSESDFIFA